jgi:hypothetical protein
MLAIRDDELNVRHDDDASSEVAEGGCLPALRKLMWLGGQADRITAILGDRGNQNVPQ